MKVLSPKSIQVFCRVIVDMRQRSELEVSTFDRRGYALMKQELKKLTMNPQHIGVRNLTPRRIRLTSNVAAI